MSNTSSDFQPGTSQEQLFEFYDKHYDQLRVWHLRPGTIEFLGNEGAGKCRFCLKTTPDVTFENEAHAIPEALGNKSLFSYYECDNCNGTFGKGIENDFGNWSKPIRTMLRIRGKNGVPAIKKTDAGWRIDASSEGLRIGPNLENLPFKVDRDSKRLIFTLQRDPYTPVAVLKAFTKMGLSIFPEEEMESFDFARRWVLSKDHTLGQISKQTLIHTFLPGPLPNDLITLMTYRRKTDESLVPHAFFIVAIANEMFQVFLPSSKDIHLAGNSVSLMRFPNLSDLEPALFLPATTNVVDLSGAQIVRRDSVEIVIQYEKEVARDDFKL
jgi:hypothetical protein